jgi:hypothetical protein
VDMSLVYLVFCILLLFAGYKNRRIKWGRESENVDIHGFRTKTLVWKILGWVPGFKAGVCIAHHTGQDNKVPGSIRISSA